MATKKVDAPIDAIEAAPEISHEEIDGIKVDPKPSTAAVEAVVQVQEATKVLMRKIKEFCPESRDRKIAMGKLEESLHYAKAAIERKE